MEISLARDLMSDEEKALFEQFILAVRAPNGRKPTNRRLVLDGIFWIARTGAPWRGNPPFLVGPSRRIQAAVFSFMAGVMLRMTLPGRV